MPSPSSLGPSFLCLRFSYQKRVFFMLNNIAVELFACRPQEPERGARGCLWGTCAGQVCWDTKRKKRFRSRHGSRSSPSLRAAPRHALPSPASHTPSLTLFCDSIPLNHRASLHPNLPHSGPPARLTRQCEQCARVARAVCERGERCTCGGDGPCAGVGEGARSSFPPRPSRPPPHTHLLPPFQTEHADACPHHPGAGSDAGSR